MSAPTAQPYTAPTPRHSSWQTLGFLSQRLLAPSHRRQTVEDALYSERLASVHHVLASVATTLFPPGRGSAASSFNWAFFSVESVVIVPQRLPIEIRAYFEFRGSNFASSRVFLSLGSLAGGRRWSVRAESCRGAATSRWPAVATRLPGPMPNRSSRMGSSVSRVTAVGRQGRTRIASAHGQ